MNRAGWTVLLVALALPACQRNDAPEAQPAPASGIAAVDGIEWFAGGLEAAFASAAAEGKPVFLYWGAEWCPPCHDLKAHVFSRSDFQQKLRQFIPVYLDGDAPGAQRVADEFHVLGYPTAVVLDAARVELARIAGGMDLASYAEVLDLALDNVQPLTEVLASLRADATRSLAAPDCRRLAYNGWTLDPLATAQPQALVESLLLAAARCPDVARPERDRLTVVAAGIAAQHELSGIEAGTAATAGLSGLIDAVTDLLADPARALVNADALLSLGEEFFKAVRVARPDQMEPMQARWFALMDALEADTSYADTERLLSAAGRLQLARAFAAGDEIPRPVAARARLTLDTFLSRQYDADARAGIVNSASWVLTYLGDDARLRALLQDELETARTPYYYMPDLADLDERAGRFQDALQWLERGYRESKGPATRFQWGVLYVEGLLRMSPQDEARIREAALAVIGELDGPDRIHARARQRLARLRGRLDEWASGEPSRAAVMAAFGARWQQICAALPEGEPARSQCPALPGAGI